MLLVRLRQCLAGAVLSLQPSLSPECSAAALEQSSITWESKVNAINAEINKFLNVDVKMCSPSLLQRTHPVECG